MLTFVMDLTARQDSVEALRGRGSMAGLRLLESGPPTAEQLTFDNRDSPDRLGGLQVLRITSRTGTDSAHVMSHAPVVTGGSDVAQDFVGS